VSSIGRSIATSIVIDAPRSRVWAVLMDFARYPEWNPFIRAIKGSVRAGETLEVELQTPGNKAFTLRPRVVEVVPERAFRWRGALPMGLFTGEHRFEAHEDAGRTRFDHSEDFSGLLVPFVGGILEATERGFQGMNEALKAEAEG
jgi:hypothetical protein